MNDDQKESIQAAAALLKALAHPLRLCIVRNLCLKGSCNVSYMQGCLDVPQSTLSQQLGILRAAGVLRGTRNGIEVSYEVIDEKTRRLLEVLFPEDKL